MGPGQRERSGARWEGVDTADGAIRSGAAMIQLTRISPEEVELGEVIDEGATAKVYKARWNGKTVAVKEMQHTRKNQIMYKREVAIHRSLSHPNIVQFFGIHIDPRRLWIVMEVCGSLCCPLSLCQRFPHRHAPRSHTPHSHTPHRHTFRPLCSLSAVLGSGD